MPNYLSGDVIIVRYPFTDLTGSKVRPAVGVRGPHVSEDVVVVPLTSKIVSLLGGEFVLADWREAGLNVPTDVKRGIVAVGELQNSSRGWLGI